MGRFSCFYGHIHSHKQKKATQPSFEEMIKMLQLGSESHAATAKLVKASRFKKLPTVENESNSLSKVAENVISSSRGWKSGELKSEYHGEGSRDSVVFMGNFRKSLSVGCELGQKGGIHDDNTTDDCVDQELSSEDLHDFKDIAKLSAPNDRKSSCASLSDRDQEAHLPVSAHLSCSIRNHASCFSADDTLFFEKEDHADSIVPLHIECTDNSGKQATRISFTIPKSFSMPNFGSISPCPGNPHDIQNRSFEDPSTLAIEEGNISTSDVITPGITKLSNNESCCKFEKFARENAILDSYDSYNDACSSTDWKVPVPDETGMMEHEQGEYSSHLWDQFSNVDFKVKRIEDWVIDLQHCSPMENTQKITDSHNETRRSSEFVDCLEAAKVETKMNPGVEAAKKYISALNATASTAHLANHGLVVIPFLSAFVGLKVLNLSGNFIVRITSGALPRGLHMLNLSKNKISTIEGLRELTRLRVLDLSYNKISRIGHGLASCSSLKELYLAGNKISEVEGLHRLLKLSVLDLRFNKIATSKCLGQLAANYNSLQAISLEGNPAQKNVGDEQLKKILLGLLPHLAYYNRQHIKTSSLKDSSDRSVRLGISAHQFDRVLRSDHKSSSRRASHGVSAHKRSSHASSHGQKGPATDSTKQSRGRHGLVPPSGVRTRHHHIHLEDRLQNLRAAPSIHKSKSEGSLTGL